MKQITPEEIAEFARQEGNRSKFLSSYPFDPMSVEHGALKAAEWAISQMQPEWVQTANQLPEIGIPVIVETYFFDSGTPSTDVFTGYMDEAGELYMYPSMDHYGWTFEECVRQWTEIPQPPTDK